MTKSYFISESDLLLKFIEESALMTIKLDQLWGSKRTHGTIILSQ